MSRRKKNERKARKLGELRKQQKNQSNNPSLAEMDIAGATSVGHVRYRNEDAFLVSPGMQLLAVCDGMGGHPGGDVASACATAKLAEYAVSTPPVAGVDYNNWFENAFVFVKEGMKDSCIKGAGSWSMGTTAVVALSDCASASSRKWHIANIGDCRAYQLRGKNLRQVTRDHGMGNIVSRYLSPLQSCRNFEFFSLEVLPGDVLLLCSDGLHKALSDDLICSILREETNTKASCDRLIYQTYQAGASDNVTVVVARYLARK